jgi:hypothetical protein
LAYSNNVTLMSLEGGAFPMVSARLWMLWNVVGSGSGTGRQQDEMELEDIQSAASFTMSFNRGPSNSSISRGIGLSLQDPGRVATDMGWWFRSGRFEADLPTDPIEVILSSPILTTAAGLTAALPAVPLVVSPATTITSIAANPTAAGMIDLTATGTTAESPLPAPVSFTYMLSFGLVPSPDIAIAETEAVQLTTADKGSVVFTGSGLTAAIEAAILNVISGFILDQFFPTLRSRIEAAINAGVLASLAGLIAPGTTTLPAGIVLSMRTIVIDATGITARGALGAFGGVFSKLPPMPSGGGGGRTCPLGMLVAFAIPTLDLQVFRVTRDRTLEQEGPQREGPARDLVDAYYRHGEEVKRLLLTEPSLRGSIVEVLPELQDRLASGEPFPGSFRRRCEALLREVGARGSEPLRDDIVRALDREPWKVVEPNHASGGQTGEPIVR